MNAGERVVGIIQARMSSSRLPGKTLADVAGRPVLSWLLHRVAASQKVQHWIVATSTEPDDDRIEEVCAALSIACHRGSLDDVLDRYHEAAVVHGADHIVRVTGDCPLLHAEVIDRVVEAHLQGRFDYTSNTLVATFPDGMDVEILRGEVLEQCWREAERPSQREHVTLWVKEHPELFELHNVTDTVDRSALRLTVDEAPDLELVRQILTALSGTDALFPPDKIYEFLADHPDLNQLNAHIDRDEGLKRSLERDPREAKRA